MKKTPHSMRVLIIEDDPDIVANLYDFLEPLGYSMDRARDGVAGLAFATTTAYDAIILDVMLPGMDGLEVCQRLREDHGCATPLLMLTARDTLDDRLKGFQCGADDYLVKPFFMAELDARLRALIARARGDHVAMVLTLGPLQVNTATLEVSRAGRSLVLTPTALRLLLMLLRAAPRVVTRDALAHEIWGDSPPDSDALRTHMHALRHALDKPFAEPMLQTVHGIGYKLVDPNAQG